MVIASPRNLFRIYLTVLHFAKANLLCSLIYLFIATILHALAVISHPTHDGEYRSPHPIEFARVTSSRRMINNGPTRRRIDGK